MVFLVFKDEKGDYIHLKGVPGCFRVKKSIICILRVNWGEK